MSYIESRLTCFSGRCSCVGCSRTCSHWRQSV